jgi:hypothetical protein
MKNSSTSAWLSAVIHDFGQHSTATPFRAHTTVRAPSARGSHPQRRFFSRPFFRHASHFHPAWLVD